MEEKLNSPMSGYLILTIHLAVIASGIFCIVNSIFAPVLPLALLFILIIPGYIVVNPNTSKVLVLFGNYKGTIKKSGFFWANPFFSKKPISLKLRNFDTEKIKVNDKLGNPIIISAVVVWQVRETALAAFAVDDYQNYVRVQSDAALRTMAGKYPYDSFEDEGMDEGLTLRSGGEDVNNELERELNERLSAAGIEIIEARINHLAYSEEIAGAMLQRQQATAVVAARHRIVEGAVSMVEMAIDRISKDDIVTLDEEKKAAMVSNLMVVLCGDRNASPVINTGTLHH